MREVLLVQEKRHTMKSFAAYADWVKSVHFCEPPPRVRVRLPGRHLVARVNTWQYNMSFRASRFRTSA